MTEITSHSRIGVSKFTSLSNLMRKLVMGTALTRTLHIVIVVYQSNPLDPATALPLLLTDLLNIDSDNSNSSWIQDFSFQFNSNSIHFLSIPIQFNSNFMHCNKQINQIIGYFKFNVNISLFAAQFWEYIMQDHNNNRINKSALLQVLG